MPKGIRFKRVHAGVDDPIYDPKDDCLSRATFAKRIYHIINGIPLDSHLRVGIYGSWGRGKTTVLNFLRWYCELDGHPVALFNPWQYRSRKEAWQGLVISIDKGLAQWNSQLVSPIGRQQVVKKMSEFARKVADCTETGIGRILANLVLSPLEGLLEQTKDKVSKALEQTLKDKRLYVFVDDLDRAEPDIIYDALMLLNEIFDLKRCIFVVALDADVASEVLKNKLGYTEAQSFLDKIINWKFQLPEPSYFDWEQLLQKEILFLKKNINNEAVKSIFNYLPKSPRKFKHFLRYLGGLHKSFLYRFAPEELDWKILYLIQLLRLEFPNEFRDIICVESTINDLTVGYIRDKGAEGNWQNQEATPTPKWEEELRKKLTHLGETQKAYFIELYKAIRENTLMLNEQHFKNHLLVLENPELLSWKEYNDLKSKLIKSQKQVVISRLRKFISKNKQLREIEIIREFFKMLLRERERYLQEVADCATQKEMKDGLKKVKEIMQICFLLTDINEIFSGDDPIFNIETAKEWVSYLAKWSHFKEPGKFYSPIRQEESELCIKLAKRMSRKASEFSQLLTREVHYIDLPGSNKAFKQTYQKVLDVLKKNLVKELVNSFESIDGIKRIWPDDQYVIEKKILFTDNIYFHNSKVYLQLSKIAKKAKYNQVVQKNFVEYAQYLFYSLFKGSSWISCEEAKKVICKIDFIKIIWSAVIAQPLNRRLVGSLEEHRNKLNTNVLMNKEILEIPQWWKLLIEDQVKKKKK